MQPLVAELKTKMYSQKQTALLQLCQWKVTATV